MRTCVLIGNHTKKMHRKNHNHKSEPSNGTKRKSKLRRFPNALIGHMVQDDTHLSSISQLWTGRQLSFLTTKKKKCRIMEIHRKEKSDLSIYYIFKCERNLQMYDLLP